MLDCVDEAIAASGGPGPLHRRSSRLYGLELVFVEGRIPVTGECWDVGSRHVDALCDRTTNCRPARPRPGPTHFAPAVNTASTAAAPSSPAAMAAALLGALAARLAAPLPTSCGSGAGKCRTGGRGGLVPYRGAAFREAEGTESAESTWKLERKLAKVP